MSTPPRPAWPTIFMEMCLVLRKRSLCVKYQTAAIVTKGTQILSIGYNGTASKKPECCNMWRGLYQASEQFPTYESWLGSDEFRNMHAEWSRLHEMHAEANALTQISKHDIDETCALYTYYSPCEQCAKQILAHGIKKVYYNVVYPGRKPNNTGGLQFLEESQVSCERIEV